MWLPPLLLLLGGVAPGAGLLLNEAGSEAVDAEGEDRGIHALGLGGHGVYSAAAQLDQLRAVAQAAHSSAANGQGAALRQLAAQASRMANGTADKAALETALSIGQQQRAAAEAAALEALEFYHTARAMLGAQGGAPSCRYLACGPHAKCALRNGRALCECDQCFAGDGFTCRPASCGPSAVPSALPLLGQAPPGYPAVPRLTPQGLEEVQLSVFAHDHFAVVARAAVAGDRGFMVVGRAGADGAATWGPWEAFSGTAKAFSPVIAGLPNGRLVVAYRDAQQGGVGYVVGGQLDAAGGLKASLQAPQAFARGQSQSMALVPLAGSRVACLYAGAASAVRPFGGIALMRVLAAGAVGIAGKYRFTEGRPISELTAVALDPSSFVVGFRAEPDSAMPAGQGSAELSVAWVGMSGGELVVGPRPLELEPTRAGMRARGLALVSQGLFAYSYESSLERNAKVAIVRVDPQTHHMSVVGGPQVIAKGRVAYVHGISLPSGPASPRTFTYTQKPGSSGVGKVCGVSAHGRVLSCKDVMWADSELKTVSGARLPDGRLVFAFANMAGQPFYQVLGSQESGMQDV